MTWVKTISYEAADPELRRLLDAQRSLYPAEYHQPVHRTSDGAPRIVAAHTLIPAALHHAFSTFGVLMDPNLPLSRRQHEMIAATVSATNRCFY